MNTKEHGWKRSLDSCAFVLIRGSLLALLVLIGAAAVVDRVAVVVGNKVFTESEVMQELRLTEFQNGEALDLSPEKRRQAADRLVDQQLIRNEMQTFGYKEPAAEEADRLLRSWRQEHYPSQVQFRAALAKYGITEDQLKQHLLWEESVIQFTQVRFQPNIPAAPTDGANREQNGNSSVDAQMDAWLKQTRAGTRVQFKEGAFQ